MAFIIITPGGSGSSGGSGGGGDTPYGGTRFITVDPNSTEVAGKVYTSIADAQTYIDTQDAPSQSAPWEIRIFGTITEDVTVRSYEKIVGVAKGSVISGTVNSGGTVTTDYFEFTVENCKLSKVGLTGTNACAFINCEITGTNGTPAGGVSIFSNSSIYSGDFSQAGTVYILNDTNVFGGDFTTTNEVSVMGSILFGGSFGTGFTASNSDILNMASTMEFSGGNIWNSRIDNDAVTSMEEDAGTYNLYTCTLRNASELNPGAGVTFNLYNCSIKNGIESSPTGTINIYTENFEATDKIPADNIADAFSWTIAQAISPVASIHGTIPGVADDDAIATSQSPAAGGAQNLTLTSNPYTVADYPKLITITSDSDCSGIDVTITGEDENGDAASEAITGPNAETVVTTGYFTEVSQIQVSGDCTNIQAGYSQALVNIDFSVNAHTMTLNEDVEFEFTNYAPTTGYRRNAAELYISGGGDVAITWPTIKWENGVTPSLSSNDDIVTIVRIGTNYWGFHSGGNMS